MAMGHATRWGRWWFGLAGAALAQVSHFGCVYKEPLAVPPAERLVAFAPLSLPPIVVYGDDEEARYLTEVLASTGIFESVAPESGVQDPRAVRVSALEVRRIRAVMVDEQPWLMWYMGVIPMWEEHDLGISFRIATSGRPKVSCAWPVEWWLGWPTLPLALLPSWSTSRDRDAFEYEMRRCILGHSDLFIAPARVEQDGERASARSENVDRDEPQCVLPTIEVLLERSRGAMHDRAPAFVLPQAEQVVTSTEGRMLQWVAVNWEGPEDGAVFMIDCTGRTLALVRLGVITGISPGPSLLGVGPTVVVRYEPGIDTNRTVELVEILAARGDAIVRLWKHAIVESDFGVVSTDGGERADDRYWWSFERDGTVIRVQGRRSTLRKATDGPGEEGAPTTQDLPEEEFCWNMSEVGYAPCLEGAH